MLAHPVKQRCLVEAKIIPESPSVFGKRLYETVEGKFNFNELRGDVQGYGKVWL
jgi:hypothetical protein